MTEDLVRYRLPVFILLLLPSCGLFSGPAYGPLVFALGGILAVYGWRQQRHILSVPWLAAVPAALLAASAWISLGWTVDAQLTRHAALQMTMIAGLSIAALAGRQVVRDSVLDDLARWLPWAMLAGAVVMAADFASHYALSHLAGRGVNAPFKYNRGVDYLMILIWPCMALFSAHGRRFWPAVVGLSLVVVLVCNQSSTAYLQLLVGMVVFGLSWWLGRWWPRLSAAALGLGTLAFGGALPFLLSAEGKIRPILAQNIKLSATHRLEIWDYMSSYVIRHPWHGWGFGSAKSLLPSPEQIATYRFADDHGIYPHNQWLESWVNLGAVGYILAAALVVAAVVAIWRLPRSLRPYACASFVAAQTLCMTSFELSTDSWWAALVVTTLLFSWQARRQTVGSEAAAQL